MAKRETNSSGIVIKRGNTPSGRTYEARKKPSGATDVYVDQDRSDGSGTLHYKERSSKGDVTKGRTRVGLTPGGRPYRATKDNKGTDIKVEGKSVNQMKWKNEFMDKPTKMSTKKGKLITSGEKIKKGFTKPSAKGYKHPGGK